MQASAKQLKVGGSRIGLVGLEEVFQEVSRRRIADEDELRRALVEGIKFTTWKVADFVPI